jgi:hypothetical protein
MSDIHGVSSASIEGEEGGLPREECSSCRHRSNRYAGLFA